MTCEAYIKLDKKESNGHHNKIEAEIVAVLCGAIGILILIFCG